MKLCLDAVHSTGAYDLAYFKSIYRNLERMVKSLNHKLPCVQKPRGPGKIGGKLDAAQEARARQAISEHWPEIIKLYVATRDLAVLFSDLRYDRWTFIEEDSRGNSLIVVMLNESHAEIRRNLDLMHRAAHELFGTCGYFMRLCGVATEWEISRRLPSTRGFAYPEFTEADRPIKVRRARKEVIADIHEDCQEHLEQITKIFQLAEEYAIRI